MPAFEFKGKSRVYAHHLTVRFRPLVSDPAWPRPQLLKESLAEDEVISVSIDDDEHQLGMLMDDILGEGNFFVSQVRRARHTVRISSKDFNLDADDVPTHASDKEWFGKASERANGG